MRIDPPQTARPEAARAAALALCLALLAGCAPGPGASRAEPGLDDVLAGDPPWTRSADRAGSGDVGSPPSRTAQVADAGSKDEAGESERPDTDRSRTGTWRPRSGPPGPGGDVDTSQGDDGDDGAVMDLSGGNVSSGDFSGSDISGGAADTEPLDDDAGPDPGADLPPGAPTPPAPVSLCAPCTSDTDCHPDGDSAGALCVAGPGEAGSFCGAACVQHSDCPDGFLCEEMTAASGGLALQCVPTDGECACSAWAIEVEAWTGCGDPDCPGVRYCAAEGLTACTAPTPGPEVCNDVDDDCDGEVDEGPLPGLPSVCSPADDSGSDPGPGPDPASDPATDPDPTSEPDPGTDPEPECTADADCAADNPCMEGHCSGGLCTLVPQAWLTLTCYDGPEGTAWVGNCQTGVAVCDPSGQAGECLDQILPTPELCGDGADTDCDGVVDDGCSVVGVRLHGVAAALDAGGLRLRVGGAPAGQAGPPGAAFTVTFD